MRIPSRKSVPAKWWLAVIVTATLFIAGGAVWMGVNNSRAFRQREAKRILENLGGIVTYDWQDDYAESPYPRWLESMLGEDFFGRVDVVLVLDKQIPGHVAREFEVLRDLESLNLNHSIIADDDLMYLRKLHKLRHLDLGRTGISDSGVKHIACLHGLETLRLDDTRITDVGLKQLGTLQGLKALNLCGTHITDTGILYLRGLHSLEELELYNTGVTPAGVVGLQEALPRLYVGESVR